MVVYSIYRSRFVYKALFEISPITFTLIPASHKYK